MFEDCPCVGAQVKYGSHVVISMKMDVNFGPIHWNSYTLWAALIALV